jgi:hypothetical protein
LTNSDCITGFTAQFHSSELHFTGHYRSILSSVALLVSGIQRRIFLCIQAQVRAVWRPSQAILMLLPLAEGGNSFGCWLLSLTELVSIYQPPTSAVNSLLTGLLPSSSWASADPTENTVSDNYCFVTWRPYRRRPTEKTIPRSIPIG